MTTSIGTGPSGRHRASRVGNALIHLDGPWIYALVVLVAVGAFGLLGALFGLEYRRVGPISLTPFDLAGERNVPAGFSALLLLAAAWFGFRAGRERPLALPAWVGYVLAAVFAYMAFDELLVIHENVGEALGVKWEIVMAPVAAAAAVPWFAVLLRLDGIARPLWIAAPACWVLAQAFEVMQYDSGVGGEATLVYGWMMVPEETLEMAGSMLFGLVLWLALLRSPAARPRR